MDSVPAVRSSHVLIMMSMQDPNWLTKNEKKKMLKKSACVFIDNDLILLIAPFYRAVGLILIKTSFCLRLNVKCCLCFCLCAVCVCMCVCVTERITDATVCTSVLKSHVCILRCRRVHILPVATAARVAFGGCCLSRGDAVRRQSSGHQHHQRRGEGGGPAARWKADLRAGF